MDPDYKKMRDNQSEIDRDLEIYLQDCKDRMRFVTNCMEQWEAWK